MERAIARASAVPLLIGLAAAPPASAVTPDRRALPSEIVIPYHDAAAAPTSTLFPGPRSAAEAVGLERRLGGRWQVVWNRVTGTAHAVYGGALRLSGGPLVSRDQVDAVARRFAHEHRDLLGTEGSDLRLDAATRANRKWYVIYQQAVGGVPVWNSYLRLQLTADGRLIFFGSDFARAPLPPPPRLSPAAAARAARAGVGGGEVEERGEVLVLVPDPAGGAELRRVLDLTVRSGPAARWRTLVDLETGAVLRRVNEVHFTPLSGDVRGQVDDFDPCDGPLVPGAMDDLRITVTDVGFTHTDESGHYEIEIPDGEPHPVHAELRGLRCRVVNEAGPEATFDSTGTPGEPLDILWDDSNSLRSERDCYFHQNRIYDHFKAIVGPISLGHLEGPFPCNVEIDDTCNAFYDGSSINFYREGDGCRNTAWIGDIIYHEYGHGLNDATWGLEFPLIGALEEGYADVAATQVTRDSRIGHGFFLASCASTLRDCANSLRFPEDVTGQAHNDGRIICGFSWDAGQALVASLGFVAGLARWDSLATFARYGRPNTMPDMVTQWFIEDDDDGILNNGTPNYDAICVGATNHGFQCPELFMGATITHAPLPDTMDEQGPYEVVATIGSTEGPIDSAYVFYSLDLAPMTALPMAPTGQPAEFSASIPGQPLGSLVRYYVLGADGAGFRATSPAEAPGVLHSFVVGELSEFWIWPMELDAGWSRSEEPPHPPDDATAGHWERVDPVGVRVFVNGMPADVTPEDDHTPDPGTMAWVTEQDVVGQQAGAHDVDGGKTTLRSPVFSLEGIPFARLRYFRWFTNSLGSNRAEDRFSVALSSDGGVSYTPLEETFVSNTTWFERRFDLNNVGPLTSTMRLRFVARDSAGPSLVEAALDDVTIEKWPPDPYGIAEQPAGPAPVAYSVRQNYPNPFNPATVIEYSVPVRGSVTVRIYDAAGRMVRTLVSGSMEPGTHSVAWDGRDDTGRPVSAGIYALRVEADGFGATRKMALVR